MKNLSITSAVGFRRQGSVLNAVAKYALVTALFLLTLRVSFAQTWIDWDTNEFSMGVGDFVRACKLSNGNWLSCFVDSTVARVRLSTNTCCTFESLSTLDLSSENRNVYNPNIIQLSNGDVLLCIMAYITDTSHNYGTNFQIRIYKSTNLGTNWSYLSTVDSLASTTVHAPDSMPPGLWEPSFHISSNGKLMCTWSDESYQPTYSQVLSIAGSSDNGATWGSKTTAAADLSGSGMNGDRPGMPITARMADGRFMMVYERTCCGAAYKISNDGENWAAGLGTLIPDQHTAPFVCPLPDGRVFVTSGSGNTKVSSDYGSTWTAQTSPIYMANTYPSIYMCKPDEMVWLMGRRDNNGASVWRGSVNPAPVEPTTTRECHLRMLDGRLRTFACTYPGGAVVTAAENTADGSWGSWTSVGTSGGFRRLDAIQNADGTMVLFGVGDSSQVWVDYQSVSNGSWSGFTSVGTNVMEDLKAFRYPTSGGSRYVVFGTDGWTIWAISQTADNSAPNANWGSWMQFSGAGYTQISPVLLPNNAFAFVGVGNGTQPYLRYQSGYQQSWSGEIGLGIPTSPFGGSQYFDCVRLFRYNSGLLTLFAGDGNVVWNITQTSTNGGPGANWGTWTRIPGTKIAQFDTIKLSNEQFTLLAVDAGTSIDQNNQTSVGGSWGGWTNVGGGGFLKVDGGQLPDGRLYLLGNGLGSSEWLKYQSSVGTWSGSWTNLGNTIF